MKWTVFSVAAALLFLTQGSSPSKILGVFPVVSKSHWAVCSSILKVLAEAGHEITVISPYILPNTTTTTYRNVHLTGFEEAVLSQMKGTIDINSRILQIPGLLLIHMTAMGPTFVPVMMEHPAVQEFLSEKNEFDLVLVEPFSTDTLYGFGEHFNAPIISVFSTIPMESLNVAVGNPEDPSYVPSPFLSFTQNMHLHHRVANYLMKFFEKIVLEGYAMPKLSKMHEKYFPNNKKSLREIIKEDVALAFVNTHFSLSFPRPYVPNMIEIGGINIDRVIGELPEEFKNFLDAATEGVVLFSMGSFLQASDFSEEQRKVIVSALGRLKQKVIWRYNLPDADQLPKNILTRNWLPQKEILAHPNVKLFITHGGMLGTTESVYYGKPMIGIPVFGDQMLNTARAVQRGYALKLDLDNLTEDGIVSAIQTILNNNSYKEKVEELSRIYKDQPMTPQERVKYWCEYVIRHKGAKHMQVESQNLSFIAYHGLDVLVILLVGLIAFVLVPQYLVIRWMWRKIFGGNGGKTKLKKN